MNLLDICSSSPSAPLHSAELSARVQLSPISAYTGITTMTTPSTQPFVSARDALLSSREDFETASGSFTRPELDEFNRALEYFDTLPADRLGLCLVKGDGSADRRAFGELSRRSNQVANYLREGGCACPVRLPSGSQATRPSTHRCHGSSPQTAVPH